MNTCETCNWWEKRRNGMPEEGWCRRYAPRPSRSELVTVDWPVTEREDFCGEHEIKEINHGTTPRETITQAAETSEESQEG